MSWRATARVLAACAVSAAFASAAGDAPLLREPRKVFVTVREWATEDARLCASVRTALEATPAVIPPSDCASDATPEGARLLSAARASGEVPLQLRVERLPEGSLLVRLEAWSQEALDGVDHLEWALPPAKQPEQDRQLRELLGRAFQPHGPWRLRLPLLDLSAATPRGRPQVGAAAIEIGSMLAFGGVWYVADTRVNAPDWRYDLSWSDLRRKFLTLDPYEFDDNELHLNSPGHVLAGTAYYLSARQHRLGAFGSLGAATVASLAWELIPEYREVISLNDLIFTPLGGFVVGEAMFQLSTLFEQSADTRVNRLLAGLFGGPARVSPLYRPQVTSVRVLDRDGFSALGWHRITLSYGTVAMAHGTPGWSPGAGVGFSAEQILRPSYGRPGMDETVVIGPIATRLELAGSVGLHGLLEGTMFSEVTYAAYSARAIGGSSGWRGQAGESALSGVEGFAGLSALFDHRERRLAEGWDRVASIAIAGFHGHLAGHEGPWQLRTHATFHPVFAGVQSLAWREGIPGTLDAPSVVRKQGYYWAWGLRAGGEAELRVAGFEAGGALLGESYLGVEGTLRDTRGSVTAWAGHSLPEGIRLRLQWQRTIRSSVAWTARAERPDTRIEGRLSWEF